MHLNFYCPLKLQGIVNMIWEQVDSEPKKWKILPTGEVELIFRIGERAEAAMQNSKKMQESDNPMQQFCFLSGLHTQPLEFSFTSFHFMGIQMRPIAVKAIFGIPLHQVLDYYIEGKDLFKQLHYIEDHLSAIEGFHPKAHWLENFLHQRIQENADLHTAIRLYEVTQQFIQQNGHHPKRSIQELMGYSRTQTYRIFKDWFGVSAHTYQQLTQFVQTVNRLHQEHHANLTTTGHQSGYFDQSHFIRSFKSFANMTPGEYKKQISQIPFQLAVG